MPTPRALLTSLLCLPALAGPAALRLDQGWRFLPGNQPGLASPVLDDAAWTPIETGRTWEAQGYRKVAGVAWYRLHFKLPAELRDADRIKGGIRLFLGKIGDCDQTFLNGKLVGTNGRNARPGEAPDPAFEKNTETFIETDRVYVVKEDDPCLNWGGENVLAVQVLDVGGAGGLASPGQLLRASWAQDVVMVDAAARDFELGPQGAAKTFLVANRGAVATLTGRITITGSGALTGRPLVAETHALELPPGSQRPVTVTLPRLEESCALTYTLTFDGAGEPMVVKESSPYVLTPPDGPAPRLNGPAVAGVHPGHPFLFTIPASGRRPMVFGAANLPKGLALDPATGIISGRPEAKGTWQVELTATNADGAAHRGLELVVGDRIALTPPMGWNSWNAWGLNVNEERVVASARAFVDKGLRDHGWAYVNIDDGWEIEGSSHAPKRDAEGRILVNGKFPDMARLGRRLHELGLRFGIYSSPGPLTCGGYTASWQHELDDAKSYASWGVDYLKYDWCSYDTISQGKTRAELMKPYTVMHEALAQVDRDIVFSLCQYGMGKVWEWGDQVGGQLWRTTGDIEDTWDSLKDIGFKRQVADAPFAKPGNWNDPDMLVVGWVGWGEGQHPSRLTADEQYTHISLWSLLSAPLLLGCDPAHLDPFTLNLLTNDEVLALDQDRLGSQAVPKVREGDLQVWVKTLADGHRAFGVFNLGSAPAVWKVDLKALGIEGAPVLRDLWRQKDLPAGPTELHVAPHGVVLIKAGA